MKSDGKEQGEDMAEPYPYYLQKYENGELEKIAKILKEHLKNCRLCPRNCGVDRTENIGVCLQKDTVRLTNHLLHFGEEPPLVRDEMGNLRGAGTVFFSGCPMRCIYCQNFGFSQLNHGRDVDVEELSGIFLDLQRRGAVNLDLVTPTPHLPFIIEALKMAIDEGFRLPIVYNTSGYEKVEILQLLDSIVDIYLVDIRYTDDRTGMKYSKVPDYWSVTKKAIREMFRQVGAFRENPFKRGVIVRILVFPEDIGGYERAFEFIVNELSPNLPVSLMSQYFPVYRALKDPIIGRKLTKKEYERAMKKMEEYGLVNGWIQEMDLE